MIEQKFLSAFGMHMQMQYLAFLQGYNITMGDLPTVPAKPVNF